LGIDSASAFTFRPTANAADRTDAQKGLVLWLELSRITAAGALARKNHTLAKKVAKFTA